MVVVDLVGGRWRRVGQPGHPCMLRPRRIVGTAAREGRRRPGGDAAAMPGARTAMPAPGRRRDNGPMTERPTTDEPTTGGTPPMPTDEAPPPPRPRAAARRRRPATPPRPGDVAWSAVERPGQGGDRRARHRCVRELELAADSAARRCVSARSATRARCSSSLSPGASADGKSRTRAASTSPSRCLCSSTPPATRSGSTTGPTSTTRSISRTARS